MPAPEFPRRDGSIVHDPRLGRLISPDSEQQRCAAYPLGYVKRFSWANTLDDLILGVGHSGPAIMGTNWYKAMDSPAINGGVKPEGRNNGGHAYLIYGVVPEGRLFLCANSWGEWYGIQGRFVVNFDDMERLLLEKGEACFFKEIKRKR